MSKKYDLNLKTKDIKMFWKKNYFLSQNAQNRRSQRRVKNDRKFPSYVVNSLVLESLQVDLMEPQKRYMNRKTKKYKILFVIDILTRYVFFEIVQSKYAKDIIPAFKSIILKIRKLQKQYITNNHLLHFTSDLGSEFTNKNLTNFLTSENCKLYHVGGSYKSASVERFIRTFENLVSAFKSTVKNFNLFKNIQLLVNLYNKRKNLQDNLSPEERLKQIPDLPWLRNISNTKIDKTFNYKENANKINKKIKKIKKKYPINTMVRILSQKQTFQKEATSETWSKEIYYIYKVKRPSFSTDNVTFLLRNKENEILTGVFLEFELKKV
jgi:hypothetical protein